MKLNYRKYGQGQPLIILHGLFGMSDNWVTLGKRFADNFEVFIIDQRNHGLSPHSNIFNYYVMAYDLAEFIDDHNIEKPIILGHSMGGKTAMLYSLENKEKVSKLIVADISPRKYELHHINIIKAMQAVDFGKVKSRKDVEEQLEEEISSYKIRHIIMKNIYRVENEQLAWKININSIAENIDSIFAEINHKNAFPKPTLFVKGGLSDYIIEETDIPIIEKLFPNYQLKTIENASHWLHAETPEAFYQIIIDFLQV